MFDSIGQKIKELAKTLFTVEVIVAILTGIALMCTGEDVLVIGGICTAILGCGVAYISALVFYAFGELVDNSTKVADYVEKEAQAKKDDKPLIDKKPELGAVVYSRNHIVGPDFWTCPGCGKSNHKTTGTCGCGQSKTK